jgi:hypothetical protein
MALKKYSLKGLSKVEHDHLALLAQTVSEVSFLTHRPQGRRLLSERKYYFIDTKSTNFSGPQWTSISNLNAISLHLFNRFFQVLAPFKFLAPFKYDSGQIAHQVSGHVMGIPQ